MDKFLYFSKGTIDSTTSTEEVAMFPVSGLSHFEMANATDLKIYFKVTQETDNDAGTDHAVVSLDIVSGKHKEVLQDIAAAINAHPNLDPCIVIGDVENSVFCSSNISTVASIVVVDAS